MIVFMSDNGVQFGEHRWDYKLDPYKEAIRVPLINRYDPVTHAHAGDRSDAMVANVNLAPTFAALAGIPFDGHGTVDGVSLVPILDGSGSVRSELLREHADFPGKRRIPSYCGLRTNGWLYVRYESHETELYNLKRDPYQLRNLGNRQSAERTLLHDRTKALCHPLPPGFTWS